MTAKELRKELKMVPDDAPVGLLIRVKQKQHVVWPDQFRRCVSNFDPTGEEVYDGPDTICTLEGKVGRKYKKAQMYWKRYRSCR